MDSLKKKKHIFFDFDDTLWDFEKNSSAVLSKLFVDYELAVKLNTSLENFLQSYKKINLELWSLLYRRQIDKTFLRDQRFHQVFNFFGYDNYQENIQVSQAYLLSAPHGKVLKEGCIETLDYLKKNYSLHIITNGFQETQKIKMDACGLAPYFKNFIISEEHGFVKPETGIFRLAEVLAKTCAAECVMIGDSLESDVKGAINAGWDAVYFEGESTLSFEGYKISMLVQLQNLF